MAHRNCIIFCSHNILVQSIQLIIIQGENNLDRCVFEWRVGGRWTWRPPTAISSRSPRPRPRCATYTALSGISGLNTRYFKVLLVQIPCIYIYFQFKYQVLFFWGISNPLNLLSWAEKSRGPCSGKCAPGSQNVTYQVLPNYKPKRFDQNLLQCVKKLASQKGVVVGEKYCQLELGKKPPAGISLLFGSSLQR